jgi:molybdenum cofactor guanylyltransferase
MGRNKAFVPIGGRPMIEVVLERIREIFGQAPLLVTNAPDCYRYLGLDMVGDVYQEQGPLGGIHAGLSHCPTSYGFVFACDMPFIGAPLIHAMGALLSDEDILLPLNQGNAEPLHAIYARACLDVMEDSLVNGVNKLVDVFFGLKVTCVGDSIIRSCPPGYQVFVNVNTPTQLDAIDVDCLHEQPAASAYYAERI